ELAVGSDVPADRIAVGPVAPRKALVDDRDLRRNVVVVARLKGAPSEKRDAHRLEVARANRADAGPPGALVRRLLTVVERETPGLELGQVGKRGSQGRPRPAGQSLEPFQELARESAHLAGLGEGPRNVYPRRQDCARVEPRIDPRHAGEGLHEEAGTHEE